MPGIDGWETIRRLRAERLSDAPLAIVSANAFDKGLDNDVGIAPEDFIVKPVRTASCSTGWARALQTRLDSMRRRRRPRCRAGAACGAAACCPAPRSCRPCDEVVSLGYSARHPERSSTRIEADDPRCAAFAAQMRALARQFQFDAMSGILRRAAEPATGAAQ